MLSLAHPRLFASMILIDPIIHPEAIGNVGPVFTRGILRRQVTWPSRQAAERTSNAIFKSWDPRVLQSFNSYGLFPYPKLGPDDDPETPEPTRLLTGRYQDLAGIVRPQYIYDGKIERDGIVWRDEVRVLHDMLHFIPCNTLYICGSKTFATNAKIRKDWQERTGSGLHLGRRMRERRVEEVLVPGAGHFVPLEEPTACANAAAKWISEELGGWEKEEEAMKKNWSSLSVEEKDKKANAWIAAIKAKI